MEKFTDIAHESKPPPLRAITSNQIIILKATTDTRTQTNSISFQYAKMAVKRSRFEVFIRQQMMLICFNLNDVIKGSVSVVIDFGKSSMPYYQTEAIVSDS